MPILTTRALTKSYGKKSALSGLDMHVRSNTVYGFLGVNGAGKTTTFGILAGFIKASSGTFEIQGKVSVLPQDAKFYRGRSAISQLEFLAQLSGIKAKNAKQEAERVLEIVELADKRKLAPNKMSHGMYKRLGIAQALLGSPDLLLLDEPTAGLDPENAYHIRQMIKELGKEKTIVISSHNLNEIADIADEIGIIHEGKMQFEGPLSEITKTGSAVEFHISEKADLRKIEGFEWLTHQEFDSEKNILIVSFDTTKIQLEEVNHKVLRWLEKEKVGIREIIAGKKLEESFLELLKSYKKRKE